MTCAWKELIGILPSGMRSDIDRLYRDTLQELRLRLGHPVQLVTSKGTQMLPMTVTKDHIQFVVNAASGYSPWAVGTTAEGYLTALGGHRIGICGEAVIQNGHMTGFSSIRSLNIRVARDFPGIAQPLDALKGNVLILGPPGSGKTTLLRDLIRRRARQELVGVVDCRGEIFPLGFEEGVFMDVISGCTKADGTNILLRTMTPQIIAFDEITAKEDSDALIRASWCGVRLLTTAHAENLDDLRNRSIYQPIVVSGLFSYAVILDRGKKYRVERMVQCR